MSILVTNPAHIIEIKVNQHLRQRAQNESHKGAMNGKSLLGGARTMEGLLCELIAHEYMPMLLHKPTLAYDLISQQTIPTTIDVKDKKSYRGKPQLDQDCTIFGYEATKPQTCDIYLFMSTNADNSIVWIKGWIRKEKLVTPENFYPAGSVRSTTQGTVRYEKDNYVVQVRDLNRVEPLKARFEDIMKLQLAQSGPRP